MTVKKFLINIKSVGIGINIAGNQETARALGLQNYFGVGTRHCRVLINIAGNQETAMPFPYLIILG